MISSNGRGHRASAAAIRIVKQFSGQFSGRQLALLGWLMCELVAFWRFRLRMRRLHMPRRADRRGSIADLQWLKESVEHRLCPLTYSRASLQQYLDERNTSRGEAQRSITWEDYYALARDCFCVDEPSREEHALLLAFAEACAKRNGLAPPQRTAGPSRMEPPIAFGSSPLMVHHKPLPFELALTCARSGANLIFLALGYRRRWMPTPEGWIQYWFFSPRAGVDSALLPCVFIHGVGLGAAPYLPFLERLRRARRAPLLVLELPNCSRNHFQACMPSAAHFRDALERILAKELGEGRPAGQYALVGHSLGTDFASMVMNDPRLTHGDPTLRPGRLVLMDPVCFAQEIPDAHRLPFWTLSEAKEKGQKSGVWWPFQFIILILIIRDEYNQEATKRAIVPGTDSIFRASPQLLKRCPTLVCLSGNDQALPAWRIHDYIRAQFTDIEVRMDPGLEHGGFLMPTAARWLAQCHTDTVLRFLGPAKEGLSRVASDPGAPSAGGFRMRVSSSAATMALPR